MELPVVSSTRNSAPIQNGDPFQCFAVDVQVILNVIQGKSYSLPLLGNIQNTLGMPFSLHLVEPSELV
jgi:hypothetical protein